MTLSTHVPAVALKRADAVIKAPDGAELRWQTVAHEGEFKGYQAGEFTLDRSIFETVVANFHRHPQYRADHSSDVTPWDIGHASELPRDQQPAEGASIVGWVRELRVSTGTGGRAELEALTRWLPLGKEKVAGGESPFASIAIVFDAIDAVTGKSVGPELTSIAITERPFLQDLPRLAASRGAQGNPKMEKIDLDQYAGANPYEKAMSFVRSTPAGVALGYDQAFLKAREIVRSQGLAQTVLSKPLAMAVAVDRTPLGAPDDRPLDLRGASGRNRFEKAIFALGVEGRSAFTSLDFQERHRLASIALRTRPVKE